MKCQEPFQLTRKYLMKEAKGEFDTQKISLIWLVSAMKKVFNHLNYPRLQLPFLWECSSRSSMESLTFPTLTLEENVGPTQR